MSQRDKPSERMPALPDDLRFDDVKKVLEGYGYKMVNPNGGSHYNFRKPGCDPITIPKHEPIKKAYVKMVRDVVEKETKNGKVKK